MKQDYQHFLWLAVGLAFGIILTISSGAVRRIPIAAAFGLLCFGCGVNFVLFLGLRRRDEKSIKTEEESFTRWYNEFQELQKKESELENERETLKDERETFEAEKEVWEIEKDDPDHSQTAEPGEGG